MIKTYLDKQRNLPFLPPSLPDGTPWPKISVITPTFNQGPFIEETIRSVLEQGYPNLEYIIVDGGSTDATPSILDKYRTQVATIIQEPDKGQSDAINKGMRLATGDILTWLNSDDLLAPGALASVAMGFFMSGADMVAGECVVFRNNCYEYTHITSCADGPLPAAEIADLYGGWQTGQFFYQPEVMFSRALWERTGGQVREDLHFCMDVELWLRFASHGAVLHVIGAPVAYFRTHGVQKTNDAQASPNEYVPVANAWRAERGLPPLTPHEPPSAPPLRLAFVNDVGFDYGAGIAHRRLCKAVEQANHIVQTFMFGYRLDNSAYHAQEQRILGALEDFNPDVVICGNLHSAKADAPILHELVRRWPTVFCLHDLWLLTGHCPHPSFLNCDKASTGCDATCPSPQSYPAMIPERIEQAWHDKQQTLRNKNLLVLSNSRWTEACFEALAPKGHCQSGRLQLGFEEAVFHPMSKTAARKTFGLAQEAFIVLLPMVNFEDPYKGSTAGMDALSASNIPHLQILCFGVVDDAIKDRYPLLMAMGYINDAKKLAQVYVASDVVVSFSQAETLGQTLVEAAMRGRAALAYEVTGLPDAVINGVSGFLTQPTPEALISKLRELHANPSLCEHLGAWGAIHARNTRSLTAAYRSLYQALRTSSLIPEGRLDKHIALHALSVEQLLVNDCDAKRSKKLEKYRQWHEWKLRIKRACPAFLWSLLKQLRNALIKYKQ